MARVVEGAGRANRALWKRWLLRGLYGDHELCTNNETRMRMCMGYEEVCLGCERSLYDAALGFDFFSHAKRVEDHVDVDLATTFITIS